MKKTNKPKYTLEAVKEEERVLANAAKGHATIAPSFIKANMECKASLLNPELKLLQKSSTHADEGTLAHSYGEKLLTADLIEHNSFLVDQVMESIEDEEMRDCVEGYYQFVKKIVATIATTKGCKIHSIHIEKKIKWSENIWGTPDCIILYTKKDQFCAYLIDYKHGVGTYVTPEENLQMLTYLAAAWRHYKFPIDRAVLTIYQPRNFENPTPDQTWVADKEYIASFVTRLKEFETEAVKIMGGSFKGKIEETPGSWCQFCHRKAICKGYAEKASVPSLIKLVPIGSDNCIPVELVDDLDKKPKKTKGKIKGEVIVVQPKKVVPKNAPESLTDEQLEMVLLNADMIMDYVKSVKKYVAARTSRGDKLPGWKLVSGRSQRKFNVDGLGIEKIKKELISLGVESPTTEKLKGLGAIESEIGTGKIEDLVIMSSPSSKLVRESDPRPALTTTMELVEDISDLEFD